MTKHKNQNQRYPGKNHLSTTFLRNVVQGGGNRLNVLGTGSGQTSSMKIMDLSDFDQGKRLRDLERAGKSSIEGKKSVFWEGNGTKMDWLLAQDLIKRHLESLELWTMVDPTQGQPLVVVAGTPLTEVRFTTPRPAAPDIPTEDALEIVRVDNLYLASVQRITQAFPGNQNNAMRGGLLQSAFADKEKGITHVNSGKYGRELTERYEKTLAHWKADEKEFLDKIKKIKEVFNDRLGTAVHAIIANDFQQNNFRRCWQLMEQTYGLIRPGETASQVTDMISMLTWDVSKYTLSEFLLQMDNLFQVGTVNGNVYLDGTKIAHVKNAINRSVMAEVLAGVIEFSKQAGDDYQAFKVRLINKVEEIKGKWDLARTTEVLHEAIDDDGGSLNRIGGDASNQGRDLSHIKCFKCGRFGHYAKFCPDSNSGERSKPEKANRNNPKRPRDIKFPWRQCEICGKWHSGACWLDPKTQQRINKVIQKEPNGEGSNDAKKVQLVETLKKKLSANSGGATKSLKGEGNQIISRVGRNSEICFMFDSGCTGHLTPNRAILDEFSLIDHVESFELADAQFSVMTEARGLLRNMPELGEFRLASGIAESYLSISQLEMMGCLIEFSRGRVMVRSPDSRVLITGSRRGKLYFLDREYVELICLGMGSHDPMGVSRISQQATSRKESELLRIDRSDENPLSEEFENSKIGAGEKLLKNDEEAQLNESQEVLGKDVMSNKPIELLKVDAEGDKTRKRYRSYYSKDPMSHLHHAYGHIGIDKIKEAIRNGRVKGHGILNYDSIATERPFLCVDCEKGKMVQFQIDKSLSEHVERGPFGLVATDDKGEFKPRAIRGYKRMDLFLFHNSHWGVAKFKKLKSEFLENFKSLLAEVETEFPGAKVHVLQTDDELIYKDADVAEFLLENRIYKQTSVPYKKQMNGYIENFMRVTMEHSTVVMNVYNCPLRFWDYAIGCCVYVYNRTPNDALGGKTPFEMVYGTIPDISHLVPFYSPGVFRLSPEERQKGLISNHAIECRFLGYVPNQNDAYLIWVPKWKKVIVRRDCIFDERLHERENVDDSIPLQWSGNFQQLDEPADASEERIKDDPHFFLRMLTNGDFDERGSDAATSGIDDINSETEAMSESSSDSSSSSDEDIPPTTNMRTVPTGKKRVRWADDTSSDEDGRFGETLKVKTNIMSKPTMPQPYGLRNKKPRFNYSNPSWVQHVVNTLKSNESIVEMPIIKGQVFKLKVVKLDLPKVPQTEQEALNSPERKQWIEAMLNEVRSLDSFDTFRQAPQSGPGAKSRFVFNVMYDNSNNIKFKARLVLCGYSQVKGRDFDQTFAPTVMKCTVFLVLEFLGKGDDWVSIIVDIGSAFLQGVNDYDIYMFLPDILSDDETHGKRVQVVKSLYGEKQAALIWYLYISNIIVDKLKFTRSSVDMCLFYLWNDDGEIVAMATLHVDDFLLLAKSRALMEEILDELAKHVKKVTRHDKYSKYLGIEIDRSDPERIVLHQRMYAQQIFKDLFELDLSEEDALEYRQRCVPMSPGYKSDDSNLDHLDVNQLGNDINTFEGDRGINQITGKLRFLADRTRPDIMLSLASISTQLQHPSDKTMEASYDLLKYIKSTWVDGMTIKKGNGVKELKLFGFCDASYNLDNDGFSRLGGCFYVSPESCSIDCFSKKDRTVSHSSTEAEIKAIDFAIRQIEVIRELLKELNHEQTEPTVLFVDNRSAIEILNSLRSKSELKHISLRIAYIREMINKRIVEICFVPSEENVADIFTKPLAFERFDVLRALLFHGFTVEKLNSMLNQDKVKIYNKKFYKDAIFVEI